MLLFRKKNYCAPKGCCTIDVVIVTVEVGIFGEN